MKQKKQFKNIIFFSIFFCILFIIFILQSSLIQANEIKYIHYENETISIQPSLETIPCEVHVTSVFKIQRENYTTESEPLILKYTQQFEQQKPINITKEIHKYSSSHTGNIYVNQSRNFSLRVIFPQGENAQTYEWILQSSCQENTSNSNMSNNTNVNNNDNNNSNNNNNNNKLNETPNNNTNNSSKSTESNNTINNSTNNSSNNESNQIINDGANNSSNNESNNAGSDNNICFQNYGVKTNKNIFSNQEQMQIDFFVDPLPSNFSVSYWIEDLYGKIIKPVRTSKNLNTKTYTFSQISADEKSYVVKGILSDDCQDQEVEKLVVVKNERSEIERKSFIHILNVDEEIKNNIHFVKVELESYKGDTSKTVIELYSKSIQTNTKISPVEKIKIPQKFSSVTQTIYLPIFKEENQIKIIATGIDANASQIISLKEKIKETPIEDKDEEIKPEKSEPNIQKAKIISAYTKHKKEQKEINWYVSIQKNEEKIKEGKIQIYYNNQSQYLNINNTNQNNENNENDNDYDDKNNTKENVVFVLKNIHNKDEILTTIQINNTIEDSEISKIKLEPIKEEQKKQEKKEKNTTTLMTLENSDFYPKEERKEKKKKEKEPSKKEIMLVDQTKKIEKETIEIISIIVSSLVIIILIWKRKEVFKSIKNVFRGLEKQL